MSERGYNNDPFGYLPKALQNDFIRDGHNRYGEEKAAVKDAKSKLQAARKTGRTAKKASDKASFEKEHPVIAARREIRAERAKKGPSELSQADVRSKIKAAKADPESHASESAVKKAARKAKQGTKEKGGYST